MKLTREQEERLIALGLEKLLNGEPGPRKRMVKAKSRARADVRTAATPAARKWSPAQRAKFRKTMRAIWGRKTAKKTAE